MHLNIWGKSSMCQFALCKLKTSTIKKHPFSAMVFLTRDGWRTIVHFSLLSWPGKVKNRYICPHILLFFCANVAILLF